MALPTACVGRWHCLTQALVFKQEINNTTTTAAPKIATPPRCKRHARPDIVIDTPWSAYPNEPGLATRQSLPEATGDRAPPAFSA